MWLTVALRRNFLQGTASGRFFYRGKGQSTSLLYCFTRAEKGLITERPGIFLKSRSFSVTIAWIPFSMHASGDERIPKRYVVLFYQFNCLDDCLFVSI